jgi:hypothetical protein
MLNGIEISNVYCDRLLCVEKRVPVSICSAMYLSHSVAGGVRTPPVSGMEGLGGDDALRENYVRRLEER